MSNQDYDENVAQDAGYAAGRAEGAYDEAGNDVRQDAQAVENAPANLGRDAEQGFDSAERGVENVPSNIGGAVEGAAKWIGDKFGGAENEADRVGNDVEGAGRDVQGDADRFGQGVQGSYEQGEQQGQQQGW